MLQKVMKQGRNGDVLIPAHDYILFLLHFSPSYIYIYIPANNRLCVGGHKNFAF